MAAPTGVTTEDATNPVAPDGRINGIHEGKHEYRLKGTTEWLQVVGSSVTVLPGTYEVRTKATTYFYASDAIEVVVGYKTSNNGNEQSPQTGDNSDMFLWIALLFVSLGGLTTTVVYKKRKAVKE